MIFLLHFSVLFISPLVTKFIPAKRGTKDIRTRTYDKWSYHVGSYCNQILYWL